MKKLAFIGVITLAVAGIVFFEQGVFTSPTSASPAIAFKDVPSDYWAKDAIQTAVDKGYVIGKSEGIFDPEFSVTRAEFIKMVVIAEKLPVTGETTGKDWYGPYVNAAVQNGIHAWSDFTYGDWNTPLTRAEMARLAVRGTGTANTDDKKWLYLATKAGLIQGMDNTGTLAEDGTTTRAQSVTIIERILAVKRGETLPADKHAISRAEVIWHKTNIFTVMPQFFGGPDNPSWNPENNFVETPDGNYRGELDELIAIDMEDPNDPYLYLLGNLDELQWDSTRVDHRGNRLGFPVKNYPNSFVLYAKGREVYRYDTAIYADDHGNVQFASTGIIRADSKTFIKGNLNGTAGLFTTNSDHLLPAIILPKKVKTNGSIWLRLYAPARVPHPTYDKDILKGPKIPLEMN